MKRLDALHLTPGDTIGVVSPGFAVRQADLESGCRALERMGFSVRLGRHVLACDGYFAGSDDQRGDDLTQMLKDPDVRAVWFARGGYGTARLLPRLRRLPRKLLIGYSDATALFATALARDEAARCLYAPVVTELGQAGQFHRPSLLAALAGRPAEMRFRKRDVLLPGRSSGRLMGGNLSVLAALCGTPYRPRLAGAILFLEDVGEPLYSLDRLLRQLGQSGCFRGIRGVLLGALDPPPRRRFPPDRDLVEVATENFSPLGVPVVRGLPVGHVEHKRTLRLGAWASIDTTARRVTFKA